MSQWPVNALTRALTLKYPIVQGPFGGGCSSAELVAAVSNAGGLGSFGAVDLPAAGISETIKHIRALTDKPFAINNWVPHPDESIQPITSAEYDRLLTLLAPYFEQVEVTPPKREDFDWPDFESQTETILREAPPVWSFVFGIPGKELLAEARRRHIVTIGAATTVEEAVALEDAGVDAVVASGSDAGGHRVSFLRAAEESFVGTFSLTPQIADAVNIPVIAAGGIGNGRAIRAAFTLGADAVQIGTRFLACHESGTSELHKASITSPEAVTTALTRGFSGRYARGIANQYMRDIRTHDNDLAPYPFQYWLTRGFRKAAGRQGNPHIAALWAGQSATYAKRQTAQECFDELVKKTESLT